MITSIIVHYKRSQNIPEIVESIRNQSVKSEIWIWDNSGDCPDIGDRMIRSSHNFYQLGRWMLLTAVESKYVWLNDDDGKLNNPELFTNLIEENNKYPDCALGWKGKKFDGTDIDQNKPYQHGTGWVGYPAETDMINMGFSFFNRSLINKILANPFDELTNQEYHHADEIWISNKIKTRVSEYIYNSVDMISEQGIKLSGISGHMEARNKLCKEYFL